MFVNSMCKDRSSAGNTQGNLIGSCMKIWFSELEFLSHNSLSTQQSISRNSGNLILGKGRGTFQKLCVSVMVLLVFCQIRG